MKEKLPQYWIVKDDCTHLYYNTVIRYLNTISKDYSYGGNSGMYYGVDGNPRNGGTDCWLFKPSFSNNPVELSLEEFINLTENFKFGR